MAAVAAVAATTLGPAQAEQMQVMADGKCRLTAETEQTAMVLAAAVALAMQATAATAETEL